MSEKLTLQAGSRKSQLALIQTNHVIDNLKIENVPYNIEIISMSTKGDNILDKPLPKVGKNVFTKELEEPLVDGSLDFVVHSMKDVSTTMPEGLTIGAVLKREDPNDAVMTTSKFFGTKLADLPIGSIVGTSSLRRAAQLRARYPHLIVKDVRGNLNTRLKKLDESGEYSAIILALAGIRRMGWEDRVSEVLPPSEMLYAVGQGALAVQCRSADEKVLEMLSLLSDQDTVLRVIAERSFMQALGGGCTAPLAVESSINELALTLTGGVWSLCGKTELMHTIVKNLTADDDEPPSKQPHLEDKMFTGITAKNVNTKLLDAAFQLGLELASYLKNLGAADVIAEAKVLVDTIMPVPEPINREDITSKPIVRNGTPTIT